MGDWASGFQTPGFGVGMGLLQMGQERPWHQPMPTGLLQSSLGQAQVGRMQDKRLEAIKAQQQAQQAQQQAQQQAAQQQAQQMRGQVAQVIQAMNTGQMSRGQGMAQLAQIPGAIELLNKAMPQSKPNSSIEIYEYAKGQGYQGTLKDWVLEKARAGGTNVTVGGAPTGLSNRALTPEEAAALGVSSNKGLMVDSKGNVKTTPLAKEPTEGQAKAAKAASRMAGSTQELERIKEQYPDFDPTNRADATWRKVPIIGQSQVSEPGQQYYQAGLNWLRANLRDESGATIGEQEAKDEFENYFPVPGDKPTNIAQKRRARVRTEAEMRRKAGRALPPDQGAEWIKEVMDPPPPPGFEVVN